MAVKSTSQQYRVSQVVLVPMGYLSGSTKKKHVRFVTAAKMYIVARKIPDRALTPAP